MIQCDLCEATVPDIAAAVDAHWWPCYFIGQDQCDPICEECAATKCHVDHGELVLTEAKVLA